MIVRYLRKKPRIVDELVPMGRHINNDIQTVEQLYVKRKKKCKGEPTGVIVAFQDETDNVLVGYSLLNPTDTFSKDKGKKIAMQRAISCSERTLEEAKNGKVHGLYEIEDIWDHVKAEYIPHKKELKCNSQTKRIASYMLDTYEFAKKYYEKKENIHVG